MAKARLKNGVFQPLDPLPVEWVEGMEVDVELSTSKSECVDDDWPEKVARAAANISDEDERLLAAEIKRIRNESRELAARGKL